MAWSSQIPVRLFSSFCTYDQWRRAFLKAEGHDVKLIGNRETLAWIALSFLSHFINLTRFRDTYILDALQSQSVETREEQDPNINLVYTASYLHLRLNRIYDLPDVIVDPNAPKRINVLVPAFDVETMSAGFFGVFQVARFIRASGYRTRLVLFDNFNFSLATFRRRMLSYPELETLCDEVEIEYIGQRTSALRISPKDNSVATVWYSAYFADKIMRTLRGDPFLYLIQDYEAQFYPGGSHFALADNSYSLRYNALISSKPLLDFFRSRKIGAFGDGALLYETFDNACTASLPDKAGWVAEHTRRPFRLAFYSRPMVRRNMFELGALALCTSLDRGVFRDRDWEFLGIGLGRSKVQLTRGKVMHQLPRMTLAAYRSTVSTFDVGLTLMASSHPSLVPFDLAASGVVTVTNTFGSKTADYFTSVSANIVPSPPELTALVRQLAIAESLAYDLEARYRNAEKMTYPCSWSQVFTDRHVSLLRATFGAVDGE